MTTRSSGKNIDGIWKKHTAFGYKFRLKSRHRYGKLVKMAKIEWQLKDGKWIDGCKVTLKRKKPSKEDILFFKKVKEMNENGLQGTDAIVQISETEAMLITWGKHGWQYSILPFSRVK